ncbi:MAG: glycosyltransferase [Vicinamibacteria bacterium]
MRILWVKVGGLWPLRSGGRLRSFHIIRELSRRHRLSVLTTHGPGDDAPGLAASLPECEIHSFPHAAPKRDSARFAAALARSWLSALPVDLWRWRVPALRAEAERRLATGDYDLCLTDFLVAAPNVPRRAPLPQVLFEHNVEHLIWRRLAEAEAGSWRRALLEIEWRKLRRFEARACRDVGLTLAVSEVDRAALRSLSPGARVEAIPTGVDADYFRPADAPRAARELVFSGSLDWYPNEDGVLRFLRQVLPTIRAELPATSFTAVGRDPSPRLRDEARRAGGVRVTGTVDDVRPFVDAAAVYVAPLRVGGGTRLKLLEALAMAKPVVATSLAAEGLPLVPGEHYLRADAPSDFAGAVVSLLRDPARAAALGQAGRRLVEERHSWRQVGREVERCLAEVAACA